MIMQYSLILKYVFFLFYFLTQKTHPDIQTILFCWTAKLL